MANDFQFDTQLYLQRLERASLETLYAVHQAAVQEAERLANELRAAYPRGKTGNLKAGVRWAENRPKAIYGGFVQQLGAHVRSEAPHVHLVEMGIPGPGRGRLGGLALARRAGYEVSRKQARVLNQLTARRPKGTSVYAVPLAIQARERFHRRVQAILDAPATVE